MAETPPLVNVQIDGVWHQFPKGTRVIEACAQLGIYIPRYCYHSKLSSPGNCRMCLIEMGLPRMGPDRKFELGADGKPVINWMPRPQICCAQDVAEGMGVRTSSPLVEECRRGIQRAGICRTQRRTGVEIKDAFTLGDLRVTDRRIQASDLDFQVALEGKSGGFT